MWIFFALFAALSYWLYNFFCKIWTDKFHPVIVFIFLNGVGFVISVIFLIIMFLNGKIDLNFPSTDFMYPILTWLCYALAEMLYVYMFSKNIKVSIWTSIVIWGTIGVAALLGMFFLKDSLNLSQFIWLISVLLWTVLLSI